MEATWLGHSTFHFRLPNDEVVLIDPFLDNNPGYPKGFPLTRVDALLITHGHYDHMEDAVSVATRFSPAKVIAQFEIATWLGGRGVPNVSGMNKGGTQDAGSVRVTMTHAVHSSSIKDGDQLLYGGEAVGYVLHLPDGRRVYFAGDTAVFSDMQLIAQLYEPEIAFLPIGDFYTMGPKEAALACRLLKPKLVVPMHYGTFPVLTGTPEALSELIRDLPGTKVETLTPGQPTKL